MNKAKLPNWLLAELPEIQEPARILFENSKFLIEGEKVSFDFVTEAYDHALTLEKGVIFHDSVFTALAPEDKHIKSFLRIREDSGYYRFLMSRTDLKSFEVITKEYEMFLALAEKYDADPNNFENSYNFVVKHPALWLKVLPSDLTVTLKGPVDSIKAIRTEDTLTFHWAFENSKSLLVEPIFDKVWNNKGLFWSIEAGEHTPKYVEHYYNPHLDAFGETIEEAYVVLASKMRYYFTLEGDANSQANLAKNKQEILVLLEEKLKELEKLAID